MKICQRGLEWFQVIDANGGVRVCSWMKKNYIGSLLENSVEEIYAGERAQELRRKLSEGNYEDCQIDNCPWLSNGKINEHLVEIDHVPEYPSTLLLAYEGICNYHCTCCSSHGNMEMEKTQDWSHNYDVIEEKIREVLPHVKCISAHGRGELFASKRILKILNEWRPVAPIHECEVSLETNGSLFDEEHWKQIENLGQYNLKVAITIMSFDEDNYRYLSGTTLPISKLENNLRFVKSLREKGIINELELATVLQEKNFREMPQFIERCINEFGADIVRIRPIVIAGACNKNIEWFADVRNPYHPYHREFLEVMKHPLMKHPKVYVWSGDYTSELGPHPGIENEKKLQKVNQVLRNLDGILMLDDLPERLQRLIEKGRGDRLSLYGIGRVGKLILSSCSDSIAWGELYDGLQNGYDYLGKTVVHPQDGKLQQEDNVILITAVGGSETIRQNLKSYGYKGEIYTLKDVLY